ncbi:MAG: YihY/virulence factor BrkB family protein [Alistipes sp.]|nr:YihY/virulence factor BrkB family protein [Alistipes sp.]MBQ8652232.1 YihY/virulence factor BrkB family protein [Alistipes sp.]
MKFKELYPFFTETIFNREDRSWKNPVKRTLVRIYKLIFYMVRGMLNHGTLIRSAAMTYYTITSLVPIVAVAFALVKGFGLADTLVGSLYGLFPQYPEVIDYVVSFAENALARTQGGLMASVALLMLFWSVIQLFSAIESAFNNIWEVKTTRSIARQWSDYLAVTLIVPILWIVAYATGSHLEDVLRDTWYFNLLSRLLSMLFMWLMFTLLYLIIPNAKVKFTSALTAGIVAGTIFLLFQWGYVFLQKSMTSYNAIYGSFAALPLFLLWVQISWQILLIGGELSFAFQNITRFGEEHEWQRISYDQRRKVMLATMLIIVRHFQSRGGALSAAEIRRELNLPTRIINDVLFQLTKAGQLIDARKNEDEREASYAPAYDIAQMSIYGVLSAVENHGDNPLEFDTESDLKRVEEILDGMKQDSLTSPRNVRLIDLLR